MLPRTGLTKGKNLDWGTAAWAGLVAYVVVYDIIAMRTKKVTLSTAFYSLSVSRAGRPLLILFWSYLSAHLFRLLPKKYDLFRRYFD